MVVNKLLEVGNEKGLHEQAFLLRADDGIRTHDINLGKVALYP